MHYVRNAWCGWNWPNLIVLRRIIQLQNPLPERIMNSEADTIKEKEKAAEQEMLSQFRSAGLKNVSVTAKYLSGKIVFRLSGPREEVNRARRYINKTNKKNSPFRRILLSALLLLFVLTIYFEAAFRISTAKTGEVKWGVTPPALYYSSDAPSFPWRKYLYGKRSDLNLGKIRLSVSVYTEKGTYWVYVEGGKFYQQLRGGGWHELRSASDALND